MTVACLPSPMQVHFALDLILAQSHLRVSPNRLWVTDDSVQSLPRMVSHQVCERECQGPV